MITDLAKIFADGRHPVDALPPDVRERYRRAAEEALQIQDACNLGGVSNSFLGAVKVIQEVARHLNGLGTEWVNQHPIVCLYISKMIHLARFENGLDYGLMHDACEGIAGDKPVYFQPRNAKDDFKADTGEVFPSFTVWADVSQLRQLFSHQPIVVYAGVAIEEPTYQDVYPKT